MRFIESVWRPRLSGTAVAVACVCLAACESPTPVAHPPAAPVEAKPVASAAATPGPAAPARDWEQLRLHAAQRIVAANPDAIYAGRPPEILLAIPVLEIELNADGSVRRIQVLRHPGQAKDTTQLAIDAVRRAAPFGDVSRLPRPWRFTETFLFNDQRKFKPRTLDI